MAAASHQGSIRPAAASTPRDRASSIPAVWLAVGVLTLIGGVARLILAGDALFADEMSTYWIVSDHGLRGVFSTVHTNAEITPPMYFTLSWLSSQFGDAPQYLRAPSVIAGIATIPLVFAVGEKTVGRVGALVAAVLITVSPFMLYYSAEARAYSVLMFFVVLSTFCMLMAAQTRETRWWVAYAIASAGAVYSHYTCVFVLATQYAWLLWAHPESRRQATFANIAAVLLFIPWLSGLRNDLNSPTSDILSALAPLTFANIWDALKHWTLGHPYSGVFGVGLREVPGIPALVLLALGMLLGAVGIAIKARARGLRNTLVGLDRGVVLVCALAAATFVGALVASVLSTNLLLSRNLASSWPALALAVGGFAAAAGPRLRVAASALLIAAFVIAGAKMVENQYGRPDHRATADYVEDQIRPGDGVVDATGFLSPGPLTSLDASLRPGIPVERAGAPAERDHPYGYADPIQNLDQALFKLRASGVRGRLFLVSTEIKKSPAFVARQRAVFGDVAKAGYRRAGAADFPGFVGARVEVLEPTRR